MAKAIIFDLDGVIVDTEDSVWHNSDFILLRKYNRIYHPEVLKHHMMGGAFEDTALFLYTFHNITESFEEFLLHRRKLVREGFANRVSYIKGFEKFYEKVKERNKAIATSMDDEFLRLTLRHLPLRKFFGKHIYRISQVGKKAKPEPDIFLFAAKNIQEDPKNCIVIEDSPNGILAAKRAGMKVIALTTSFSQNQLTIADCVVTNFSKITEEMLS